jgi:hypothetical protein
MVKPLGIALVEMGRGLQRRDGGGSLTHAQCTGNCYNKSPLIRKKNKTSQVQ